MRIYPFNLTLNTRDLGGYIGEKEIKYCRIIRSDALRYIDEKDKEFLISNNVLTQIDLRTEEITKRYPSRLEDDGRFDYKVISLHEGSLRSLSESNDDIPALYMRMINNTKTIYQILKTIADCKTNIILNCTAGKDRTGIICFFVLSICGVDINSIKEDYITSSTLIEKNLPKVREAVPTFPSFLGYSKEEYFDGFIEKFIKEYHSVDEYLSFIGITDEDKKHIKERMFD